MARGMKPLGLCQAGRIELRFYLLSLGCHRLYCAGKAEEATCFSAIADLIAEDTGLLLRKVRAALAAGFASRDTQDVLAAWCGLRIEGDRTSGKPVLRNDPRAVFDRGPLGKAGPVSFDEIRQRMAAAEARFAQRQAEAREARRA